MFEWSDEHAMVRDAVRQFVDNEIRPRREELEFGDVPPYDVLRKMFQTFGLDALAREQFKKRIERERTAAEAAKGDAAEAAKGDAAEGGATSDDDARPSGGGGAMFTIPIIELCRRSPGLVTGMGVSVGATAAAAMSQGTIEEKERGGVVLLTPATTGAGGVSDAELGHA